MPVLKGYVSSIWVVDKSLPTENIQISLQNIGGRYFADSTYLYALDTTSPFAVRLGGSQAEKDEYTIACRVGPIIKVLRETMPTSVSVSGSFRPISFFHETARECNLNIEVSTEDITTLGNVEASGYVINAKTLKSATMSIPGFLSYSSTRDYYTIQDLLNDEHEIFVQFFLNSGANAYVWVAEGVANVSIDSSIDSIATMDLDITINGMVKLYE